MNKKTSKVFALLIAVCIFAMLAGCTAQVEKKPTMEEVELIPRKFIIGNPDKTNPKISPDGKRIAYLAPVNGVMNVWVGPSDDISQAKPVTNDTKSGVQNFEFAMTSNHVLFMQDQLGNENFHILCTNLNSGQTKDLTPGERVDAWIYAVSAKIPEKVVIGICKRNESYSDPVLCDITTGEQKMLFINDEYSNFNIDNDLNLRFLTKDKDDGGMEIYIFENGKPELYDTIPFGDDYFLVTFDKTNENFYSSDSRGKNTSGLYLTNIKTKEKKLIIEDEKADIWNDTYHPTELYIQAAASLYEKKKWMVLDEGVKADFDYLESMADKGEFDILRRTLADDKWIVEIKKDIEPVSYHLYDRTQKKLVKLFTARPDLEKVKLTKMWPVVVKASDGLELVCNYSLPLWSDTKTEGKPDNPLPMVVNVHGGPWARDFWGYDSLHQWFANRGYAVLSVNYRSSVGFGKNFVNAGNGEWAGKIHQDVLDAVDWAIKEGIADEKKICIYGSSFGGYEALVGITFTPDKFACAIDVVGISSILTFMNTVPASWKPTFDKWVKGAGGDPTTEEGREILKKKSPITYVDKIKVPLLIGHGQNDPRVKVAESEQIVKSMKSKNLPVTFILFPDEGHGFKRSENKIAFFAVVEKFLAKFLGGRYEEIGDSMNGSSITVPEGAELIEGLKEALPKPKEPEKPQK